MMTDYEDELRKEREQKNRYFVEHPNSPIPPGERETFQGLTYFDPDPEYRFEVPLHDFDDRDSLTVETTQEGQRTYLRWGEFRFEIAGRSCSLTAFKADRTADRLWIPFRDETNGDTTYAGGRYLDLEESDRLPTGDWRLDFNRAYTPFCAFNDEYECPLVPTENWLQVRIEAGERVP